MKSASASCPEAYRLPICVETQPIFLYLEKVCYSPDSFFFRTIEVL